MSDTIQAYTYEGLPVTLTEEPGYLGLWYTDEDGNYYENMRDGRYTDDDHDVTLGDAPGYQW